MPYRRLPNTDNARIKALRIAINKGSSFEWKGVITADIRSLDTMLRNFESSQRLYKTSLDTQVSANRKLQKIIKSARLYVSHFIQVLNFGVIRNEIKKDLKELYNLDPNNFAVPDLTSNDSLLSWGESIIRGEQIRLAQGGIPIYNPTIARVNVAVSQFKDAYVAQKTYQNTTSRHLESLALQREGIDKTLISLWNQIESAFADLSPDKRIERCKEFGVIYYLRKGEKEQKTENEYN